jgi:hypothetical protein
MLGMAWRVAVGERNASRTAAIVSVASEIFALAEDVADPRRWGVFMVAYAGLNVGLWAARLLLKPVTTGMPR